MREDFFPEGGRDVAMEVASAAQRESMRLGKAIRKGGGVVPNRLQEGQGRGISGCVGKKLIGSKAPRWR
jgi:hypothetical protein